MLSFKEDGEKTAAKRMSFQCHMDRKDFLMVAQSAKSKYSLFACDCRGKTTTIMSLNTNIWLCVLLLFSLSRQVILITRWLTFFLTTSAPESLHDWWEIMSRFWRCWHQSWYSEPWYTWWGQPRTKLMVKMDFMREKTIAETR